jgi:hypothetical protein
VLVAVELAISGRTGIVPPGPAPKTSPPRRMRAPVHQPVVARIVRGLDHDPASVDTAVRRRGRRVAEVAGGPEQRAVTGEADGTGGSWSRSGR